MNLLGAPTTALRARRVCRGLAVLLVLCAPASSDAWELDCSSGRCRVIGFANVRHDSGSERIALEITKQGDVLVTALYTRAHHREFFRTNPRTFARLDGKDFVADTNYFDDRLPASLAVDAAVRWPLRKRNAAQFRASSRHAEKIVQTLARGDSATVTYASAFWGEGQTARFPLLGFKEALASLKIERPKSAVAEPASIDAVSVVQRLIGKNEFGIQPRDLRSTPNTRGKGHFVYVSGKGSPDREQEFLWFVNEGMAVNLTEATHELTPALKHPREASPNFWKETGLSDGTVRLEGLKKAFGD